ncbi:hypothetical protein F4677DRAFT_416929 [Hypoxylon crocopeplum]|nr:hypothetical protein F4677DRAFT_416929 [Hypoxylon crocopeplum]
MGTEFPYKLVENVVDLRVDPNNHLNKPEEILGLVKLGLYQPIFYYGEFRTLTSGAHIRTTPPCGPPFYNSILFI